MRKETNNLPWKIIEKSPDELREIIFLWQRTHHCKNAIFLQLLISPYRTLWNLSNMVTCTEWNDAITTCMFLRREGVQRLQLTILNLGLYDWRSERSYENNVKHRLLSHCNLGIMFLTNKFKWILWTDKKWIISTYCYRYKHFDHYFFSGWLCLHLCIFSLSKLPK